ncbi:transcription repressor OFP13-like [Punica granatum]|uniref:Transcription repressor n=2 Tax=Punica granatum TaxID=22663 RepID=A0A218X1G5_PUNGR|nr:transcription repressor OFP13-like [Punica granatum]OWM79045.1 hypothetical protein CDL15_Pgr003216 [Punica granatum]PKI37552.1 hypothetical protein CRG98_042065 [Punica granatum]
MKLSLPFLSKTTEEDIDNTSISYSLPWPWPYYCHRPRTLSFRTATDDPGNVFKTINTAYSVYGSREDLESHTEEGETEPPESEDSDELSIIEMAVRGLRSSERLFFEPGETRSILEELKRDCKFPLIKDSLVMSMESQDPYVDFRKSMEDMVRAYGLKEWEDLKGLLDWYLRVNGKANHGHILGAFVDLLVLIQTQEATSYPSTSTADRRRRHHDYNSSPTPSSPLSLCTSSASSSSSSNSLSTPSVSIFEPEERCGGGGTSVVPCLSFEVAEEFEIR